MGQYTNKGLYNAYKKNNKEREEKDYYSTPTDEVYNILSELNYDFSNQVILEPCIGGGHMAKGIERYLKANMQKPLALQGSDVQDRGFVSDTWHCFYGDIYDFLKDDYPIDCADVIIMNPPYSTLEPFLIRALEIAQDKLIVLCRMQVLEGEGRYEKIFADENADLARSYGIKQAPTLIISDGNGGFAKYSDLTGVKEYISQN